MRRLDLTFIALRVPLDGITLMLAALVGYLLRHTTLFTEIKPLFQAIPFEQYFSYALLFIALWIIIFALSGLYSTKTKRFWDEIGSIIVACSAGTMVLIASIFFGQEYTASRFLVVAMWLLSIVFISIERFLIRQANYFLLRRGIGHQRIIVIGQDKTSEEITTRYKQNPVLGVTVIKRVKTWSESTKKDLTKLRQDRKLDGILLTDNRADRENIADLFAWADEMHVAIRYIADPVSTRAKLFDITMEMGVPIIEIKRTPLDGWGKIAKRVFDVILSIIILTLTSPIWIFFSLARLIEDGFPIIFKNTRVGEKGMEFNVYKLRSMWKKMSIGPQFQDSMKKNLELEQKLIKEKSIKEGPVYKIANDPRITPIGNFIRRWSIDELPQFFNVLQGNMSIIGPRPHQPREVEKYTPEQKSVLAIKPGITGMAQISGRSDLSFEDEVRLDTWYIENWSIWLDLYILLKTPLAVFKRKGVY